MNSSRMNKLEELGRVDAEKADTSKGKRNLSDEKSRIVRELKAKGGKISGNKGALRGKIPGSISEIPGNRSYQAD